MRATTHNLIEFSQWSVIYYRIRTNITLNLLFTLFARINFKRMSRIKFAKSVKRIIPRLGV